MNNEIIPHISKTYTEIHAGKLLALKGSSSLLEISVRDGSAKDLIKAEYNEQIIVDVS